jgi:hypothetical protein
MSHNDSPPSLIAVKNGGAKAINVVMNFYEPRDKLSLEGGLNADTKYIR